MADLLKAQQLWFVENQFSSESAITLPGLSEVPKAGGQEIPDVFRSNLQGLCWYMWCPLTIDYSQVQMLCLREELNFPPRRIYRDHSAYWAIS